MFDGTNLFWVIAAGTMAFRGVSAQAGPIASSRDLSGAVVDSFGVPISYAYVSSANTSATVTNSTGQFTLKVESRNGTVILGARRIGYSPVQMTIRTDSLGGRPVRIEMLPIATQLNRVVVTSNADGYHEDLDKAGYYRRLGRAIDGSFISPREVERRNPSSVTQLLGSATGLRILSGNGKAGKNNIPLGRGGMCAMGLVVDNTNRKYNKPSVESLRPRIPGNNGRSVTALHNPPGGTETFDDMIPPSQVLAIEVYPSASSVPNEFQHHVDGCGLVVVWTKYR